MMYEVQAILDGRFWLVRVPAIERSTQARNVAEIEPMAKELIELMTGEIDPQVNVKKVLPKAIEEHLIEMARFRVVEEKARRGAAAASRAAAKLLRDQNLTLVEVGAVLGVSHQRAHQLVS